MKEEKKGKPTKINKWEKDGVHMTDKYQNYIYFVEMEDGDKGAFLSKSNDQKNFVVGQEINYLREVFKREGKDDYIKYSLPKPAFTPGFKSGYQQMTLEEYVERKKADTISFSMSYAKDLAQSSTITLDQMSEYAKKMNEWQYMMLDKLTKTQK